MKRFRPTTVAQKRKYHKIVKARPGQLGYEQQIKEWNHYAKRAYWYAFSPAKHQLHVSESMYWAKNNKHKVRKYRLRSYFKRFTEKLAYIVDLQEELRWILIRKNQLINPRVKNTYHRLRRNSDIAGAEIKDLKKRRRHHQYRSYAHHYIMSIADVKTLLSTKHYIVNIERSKD